jgi:hypothetical protein
MLNKKDLIEGENYIHVNRFDGTKTEFTYMGKTDYSPYTVVIKSGVEGGVKSFLVPLDVIISKDDIFIRK